MTTWVIITWHPPQLCQTSNRVCGDLFKGIKAGLSSGEPIPGFRLIAGPFITSDHRSFLVAESESYDLVRKFAVSSGAIQWNSVETIPVISNDEAVADLDTVDFIWGNRDSGPVPVAP